MSRYDDYTQEALDEAVHDEMSRHASNLNNEGREAQIAFLENADIIAHAVPMQEGGPPSTIQDWETEVHGTAVEKGWWDEVLNDDGTYDRERVEGLIAAKLLLMVSEICEAFEEFRSNHMETYWEVPSFGMVTVRLVKTMDLRDLGTLETCIGYGTGTPRPKDEEQRRKNAIAHMAENFKPEGFGVEMADALIRQFDLCKALTRAGIPTDLQQLVLLKSAYNEKRSYRHGGKRV